MILKWSSKSFKKVIEIKIILYSDVKLFIIFIGHNKTGHFIEKKSFDLQMNLKGHAVLSAGHFSTSLSKFRLFTR